MTKQEDATTSCLAANEEYVMQLATTFAGLALATGIVDYYEETARRYARTGDKDIPQKISKAKEVIRSASSQSSANVYECAEAVLKVIRNSRGKYEHSPQRSPTCALI